MANHTNETRGQNRWSIFLEVIKVGLPVLTLVLGYFIYAAQAKLQDKIDSNAKVLEDQLRFQSALKEEFYKRRLTAYENACKELAASQAALNNAGADLTQALGTLAKFDEVNKSNTLYWSQDLQNNLDDFWGLGTAKLQEAKWDDPEFSDNINKMVMVVHRQMKSDLNVADLSIIMYQSK